MLGSYLDSDEKSSPVFCGVSTIEWWRTESSPTVLKHPIVWRSTILRSRKPADRPVFRQLRRVRLGLVAVLTVVAATLAVPGSASADSVGCGSPCDNKDPQTYNAVVGSGSGGCYQDARTVASATYVELRYSPWCRTAWGRQTGSIGWLSGVLVQSFNSSGTTLRASYDSRTTGGSWSRMANDKNLLARACFYQYDTENDYYNDRKRIVYCTSKY
ncbi:DUF2690 domain-containing protein [Micromonospora yangpuensis]|uniref:DUF2690 domain-containing protein n=1 Tax=Micromonospora yangpuensis TaxID=683228 RepID=UPI000B85CFF9